MAVDDPGRAVPVTLPPDVQRGVEEHGLGLPVVGKGAAPAAFWKILSTSGEFCQPPVGRLFVFVTLFGFFKYIFRPSIYTDR